MRCCYYRHSPHGPYGNPDAVKLIRDGIPLLYPTLALASGIAYALICYSWIVPAIVAIAALLLFITRKISSAALLLIFLLGWGDATLYRPDELPGRYSSGNHLFSGTIERLTESDSAINTDIVIDSIDSHSVDKLRVRLTIIGLSKALRPFDRISWKGSLSELKQSTGYSEMTDVAAPLRRRGISATSIIRHDSISTITGTDSWRSRLLDIRLRVSDAIYATGFDSGTAVLLDALLLGDTSAISPQVRIQYSAAGLSHILALSGLHVAIIAMIITLALWPLMLPFTGSAGAVFTMRRTIYAIVIGALWGYCLITGLSPSVVRAVVMATVYGIGRIIQRNTSPYNSLCLAAMIILVAEPLSIVSYGFQLSFAAVLAILLFANKLNPVNQRKHPTAYAILSLFTVSVAAMLGTGLLSAFYFHTFPMYFLISAIVASIIVPIICIAGVLATFLNVTGIHAKVICALTDFCTHLLEGTASWLSTLPGAEIGPLYFTLPVLIGGMAAIMAAAAAIHTRRIAWILASTMLICFSLIVTLFFPDPAPARQSVKILPYDGNVTLMIRDEESIYLLSDISPADTLFLKHMVQRDFADYIAKERISAVLMALDSLHKSELSISNGNISFSGVQLSFVPAPTAVTANSLMKRIIIPTRRFSKKHIDVLNQADTIVLSPALTKRQETIIKQFAAERKIPLTNTLSLTLPLREPGN